MSDVRHYFSDMNNLLLVATLAVLVSACSTVQPDLGVRPLSTPVAINQQKDKHPERQAATPKPQPVAASKVKATNVKNTGFVRPVSSRQPIHKKSAWCNYLTEDAAAQSTVLLGPTLSAGVNDDGRKNLGVGYNLVNIARAKLVKDAAELKCRRYLANAALNRMAVSAAGRLSREGFNAKAKVIRRNKRKILAVKVLVKRELEIGNLDRSQSTKLLLAADELLALGERAASQAAKRKGLLAYDLNNVEQLSRQLVKAEKELADVNSNIRSAEAVAVNLDGGWREGQDKNGVRVQNDSFYGGVKFSVKLGAFNPARFKHEQAAARARIRAYRDEPGGAFWKLQQLKIAHINGKKGMLASKRALVVGRSNALRLKENLPANDPYYHVQRYSIQLQIIKLNAEIAGVSATLIKMDKNLTHLGRLTRTSLSQP